MTPEAALTKMAYVLGKEFRVPRSLLLAGIVKPSIRSKVEAFEADPIRRAKRLNNEGMIHEHLEEWDLAEACYREALLTLPHEAMIWNNLGLTLQRQGKSREALQAFYEADRLSKHEPSIVRNLALGHFARAISLQAEGLWEPAIDHLREALLLNPTLPRARFSLVILYQRLRDWKAMLDESHQILQQHPDSSEAWHASAIANAGLGQRSEVLLSLQQAVRFHSTRSDIIHWYAIELSLVKRYAESISYFERYLRIEPKDGKAWHNLGLTQIRTRQIAQAIPSLQQAKAYWKSEPRPILALAAAYEQNQQPERAIKEYQALLQENDKQSNLWKLLGVAQTLNHDWISAAGSFQTALKLDPRDPEAWVELGCSWIELGENREAEDAYLMAIKNGEKSPLVWNNLGIIQSRLGFYDRAIESFQKALAQQKNDPDVLLNMGLTYFQARRISDADYVHLHLSRIHPQKAHELRQFINRRKE
jgi:tetratricopeptide (TPR) repeat protein